MNKDELIEFYAKALAMARFGPDGQSEPLPSDYRKAEEMYEMSKPHFDILFYRG